MQVELRQLEREVSLLDPAHGRKSIHFKLLNPVQYRIKHEKHIKSLLAEMSKDTLDANPTLSNNTSPSAATADRPQITESLPVLKCTSTTPPKKAAKDPLAIDMNIAYPLNLTSKRERKPRMIIYRDDEFILPDQGQPAPSP